MDKYEILSDPFRTTHCVFYRATNKLTREPVSVKKLRGELPMTWETLLKCPVLALMKDSKFPNYARLFQVVREGQKYYFIHQQLAQNLQTLIAAPDKIFNSREVIRIASQCIDLFGEAVKRQIIFQELFPDMFCYNSRSIKLVHGLTEDYIKNAGDSLKNSSTGSVTNYRYLAPEILSHQKPSQKSMIFCLGVILCELFLKGPLIQATTRKEYFECINRLFPDQQLESVLYESQKPNPRDSLKKIIEGYCQSKHLLQLICLMLRVNPNDRISFKEAKVRISHIQKKLLPSPDKGKTPKIGMGKLAALKAQYRKTEASKEVRDSSGRSHSNSEGKSRSTLHITRQSLAKINTSCSKLHRPRELSERKEISKSYNKSPHGSETKRYATETTDQEGCEKKKGCHWKCKYGNNIGKIEFISHNQLSSQIILPVIEKNPYGKLKERKAIKRSQLTYYARQNTQQDSRWKNKMEFFAEETC